MDHFIFQHQFKTGGQTLQNLLQFQYSSREIFHIGRNSFDTLLKLDKYDREQIKLVAGHLKFGIHHFFSGPCYYLSIIRHPVNRMISLFYYIHKQKNKLYQLMPPGERGDLKTFIQHVNKYSLIHGNDGQTYLFSGADFRYPGNESWDQHIQNQINGNLYEQALSNVRDHFVFIGTTELFDESVILMKKHLGWTKPLFYLKRNKTQKQSEVDRETIDLIKEKNQMDLKLYEYVSRKLMEEIEANKHYVEKEKKKLHFNNNLYSFYRHYVRKYVNLHFRK